MTFCYKKGLEISGFPSHMLTSAHLLTYCPNILKEGRPTCSCNWSAPIRPWFTSGTDNVSKRLAAMRHTFWPFCIHVTRTQVGVTCFEADVAGLLILYSIFLGQMDISDSDWRKRWVGHLGSGPKLHSPIYILPERKLY